MGSNEHSLLRTFCIILVLVAGWVMALTIGLITVGRDTTTNTANVLHIAKTMDEIKGHLYRIENKLDRPLVAR